jgi:hypothetical protein
VSGIKPTKSVMGGQRSGARAHNRRRTQQLLADLLAGQHAVARLIRQSHSSANQNPCNCLHS